MKWNTLSGFCCFRLRSKLLWGILGSFTCFALRTWIALLFGYSLCGGLFNCADCAVVATGLNRQCLTCLTGPGWPWGSVNIYSVWPWQCWPPVKHDSCSVCSPSTTLCPLTKWCKGTEMSHGWKLLKSWKTSSNQFGIRESCCSQASGRWISL